MSPKQHEFIRDLLAKRQVPDEGPFALAIDAVRNGLESGLDKARASEVITYLQDLPDSKVAPVRSVRPGVYQHVNGLVRVRQVYGKRDVWSQVLTQAGWQDRPGIELEPRSRLKSAGAVAFIKAHQRCPWCLAGLEQRHANRLQDLATSCARKFSR